MPEFVEYGSLMTPPPPFRSMNTKLWGFWMTAGKDELDALCRKVFYEPSQGEVDIRPLGRDAMISWGDIGGVFSQAEGYEDRGGVAEPQVSVWIPVVRVRERLGVEIAQSFAMFVPYIWLDNAMSLATGRELFGYPKAWGEPKFPQPGATPSWTLDVFGLDWGTETLAARHRLLELTEGESLLEPGEAIETFGELVKGLAQRLFSESGGLPAWPGLNFMDDLFDDLRDRAFHGIFLKQFRAAEDTKEACLQQIVTCRYEVTRLQAKALTHEHHLKIHHLDSHPLAAELGIAREQGLELGYMVEMDFNVGDGRVIWPA